MDTHPPIVMYSDQIREILDEKGIEIGDTVKVNGREGRLMPKPENGDPESIVLKLESGYNIGLKPEKVELVESNDFDQGEKPELKHSEDQADILILHTGGTIASRVSYETGGVKAEAFEPEDVAEMYPETAEEVNIHSDTYVGKIMSEDMQPGHWQGLARKIDEVKDDFDGIVIGHGTDTLGDTAAALSLMLSGIDTGVVLVGAQRSSDRPSSDASMNVYCASKFLAETDFCGVSVCMHRSTNDDLCAILPGAKTRKMHTSRRDAFEPVNSEEIGNVNYETGEIEFLGEVNDNEYDPRFDLDEDVGYLKVRPGTGPEELQFLIDQDYSGVVIEGTGLGHMPISVFDEETEHHREIQEKLEELTEDTLTVMASNCIHGRVNMDVYDNQLKVKKRGVIESEDMHPELAYVKLMWSLGNSESIEEAKELFRENIAGEIQKRTIYDERTET